MPVRQHVRPTIVGTWIYQALAANEAWTDIHGDHFWESRSVLAGSTEEDFPYGYWMRLPGGRAFVQHLGAKAFIGKVTHTYRIASVRRYDSPFDEADFDASTQALMQALTGIGGVDVERDDEIIGYIDSSKWIDFYGHDGDSDGDVRIPERGIQIEVVYRGVPEIEP